MTDVLPDIGINPDWGLKQGADFRVQKVRFGDGYEQRRPDGVNSVTRKWSVSWGMLTEEQKDLLVNFLYEQKGAYSFIWNVPESSEAYQVICRNAPEITWDDFGSYVVTAEFEEDFSL